MVIHQNLGLGGNHGLGIIKSGGFFFEVVTKKMFYLFACGLILHQGIFQKLKQIFYVEERLRQYAENIKATVDKILKFSTELKI